MNKLFKLFGIIALAAAIGLSFAGCDTGGGTSKPSDGSTGGGGSGNSDDFIDIPLEFKGKTSDNKEITISLIPDSSDSRVAVNTRNAISYVIKKADEIISSGKITFNGSVKGSSVPFTFTPSSGDPFPGSFENYKENIVVETLPGNVQAVLGAVSEGNTVTITGINNRLKFENYIFDEAYIDRIGVWLFETIPEEGQSPVNTAIQSMSYRTDIPPVFNLVVPRDNTWNGDPNTGKAQPRWNGTGSYYVMIAPIIYINYYAYFQNLAYWIYTGTGTDPVKVNFNSDDVTLPINQFKIRQSSSLVTKTQLNTQLDSVKTEATQTELQGICVNIYSVVTAYAFKGNGFAEVRNGNILGTGTFTVNEGTKTITFTPSSGSYANSPWNTTYKLTSSGGSSQVELQQVPNHNYGPFKIYSF